MNNILKLLGAVGAAALVLSAPAAAQGYGLDVDGVSRAQYQQSDDGSRGERRRERMERRGGGADGERTQFDRTQVERSEIDRSGRFEEAGDERRGRRTRERVVVDEAGDERRGRRTRERVVVEEDVDRRVRRGPLVIERRVVRPGPRVRTVCTTRVRERLTPGGVLIRRPVEVCRQVVGRFGRPY